MSQLDIDPEDRRVHMEHGGARPRAQRRFIGPVLAVVIGVAVVVGAFGMRYGSRLFTGGAPGGAVPVIGADQGPVKEQPRNPGGMKVPDQDKIILNGNSARPKVEQLLPPPEAPVAPPQPVSPPPTASAPPEPSPQTQPQVKAEPAPTPQVVAPTPAPTSPPQTVTPPMQLAAPAAPPAPPAPPVSQPQTQPQQQATAPAVTPAPPKPAPAPQATKPASVPTNVPTTSAPAQLAGKGYFLQLGAVRTNEAAQSEWTRVKNAQSDVLGSLAANAVRVDLGPDKGIYYRILAGPIRDEGTATRACATLKQRNVGCILVKP